MILNICPDTGELDDLLNEQVDADHEARLVAHIQTCEACQEQLDRLTAGCEFALNDGISQHETDAYTTVSQSESPPVEAKPCPTSGWTPRLHSPRSPATSC